MKKDDKSGSTAVLGVFNATSRKMRIANVGDSRVFLATTVGRSEKEDHELCKLYVGQHVMYDETVPGVITDFKQKGSKEVYMVELQGMESGGKRTKAVMRAKLSPRNSIK